MAEPFSVNDVFYISCKDSTTVEECKYKDNVDALNTYTREHDTSTKLYSDFTEEQSAMIMSNIGLGIGILAMLYTMNK